MQRRLPSCLRLWQSTAVPGSSHLLIAIKAPACLPASANLSLLPFFPPISLLVFNFILHFTLSSHLSPFSSNHPSRKYRAKPLLCCLAFYMRQKHVKTGTQPDNFCFCLPAAVLPRQCWRWLVVRQDRDITFSVPATTRKTDSLRWKDALRRSVDAGSSPI